MDIDQKMLNNTMGKALLDFVAPSWLGFEPRQSQELTLSTSIYDTKLKQRI